MNILDTVLPEKDRELLIRPFDGRWEAIITIYRGDFRECDRLEVIKRGVSSRPNEAIERAEKNLDPDKD